MDVEDAAYHWRIEWRVSVLMALLTLSVSIHILNLNQAVHTRHISCVLLLVGWRRRRPGCIGRIGMGVRCRSSPLGMPMHASATQIGGTKGEGTTQTHKWQKRNTGNSPLLSFNWRYKSTLQLAKHLPGRNRNCLETILQVERYEHRARSGRGKPFDHALCHTY